MLALAAFWEEGEPRLKKEVAKMFRCMAHGGQDPSMLRCERKEWVGDSYKKPVTDTVYIQNIIRDSLTLGLIVDNFNSSVTQFRLDVADFLQLSGPVKKPTTPGQTSTGAGGGGIDYDSDDDVQLSAIPPPVTSPSSGSPRGEGVNGSVVVKDEKKNLDFDQRKAEMVIAQELAQTLFELCQDLAVDDRSTSFMCANRFIDGAVNLLAEASKDNPRDPRVSEIVNLMWTMLEVYLNQRPKLTESTGNSFEEDEKIAIAGLVSVEIMNFEVAVSILQGVFMNLLCDGYRLADKECRNEIIVVLSMIARFPSAAPCFLQCGLFNKLITYSCVGEAGPKAWPFYSLPLAKMRNFSSAFDVDLQLKRELWVILSDLMKFNDPDALLCFASSPLMSTLLMYLEFDTLDQSNKTHDNQFGLMAPAREGSSVLRGGGSLVKNEGSLRFMSTVESSALMSLSHILDGQEDDNTSVNASQSLAPGAPGIAEGSTVLAEPLAQDNPFLKSLPINQLRELQVVAMMVLAANAPKVVGEFSRLNGPVKILDIIFHYARSSVAEHKEITYYAVILLNRCIMGSNVVRKLMEDENAVQTLISLFDYSDDDRLKAQAVRVIAMLCSGHNSICQQQLRINNGLTHLVKMMSSFSLLRRPSVGRKAGIKLTKNGEDEVNDPSEDPRMGDISVLIVAVLDCLKQGVVGNRKNEARLAKEEGIDALLDLLEVSPFVARTQILRLISDLCENRRLIVFLHAWRSGKTMRSATQLCAHCWLDEECRLDGKRLKGIIGNLFDPLGNHDWPDDTVTQIPGESMSSVNGGESIRSVTVSKLTNAIMASRGGLAVGAVPMNLRARVLEKDSRTVISYMLQLMGLFDDGSNDLEAAGKNRRMSMPNDGDNTDDYDMVSNPGGSGYEEEKVAGGVEAQGPLDETFGSRIEDSDYLLENGQVKVDYKVSNKIGFKAYEGDKEVALEDMVGDGENENEDMNDAMSDRQPKVTIVTNSGDMGLSAADKQVIAVAKRFFRLREGEWWRALADDLVAMGVTPIEADLAMIEAFLERSFDASISTQLEQMELLAWDEGRKRGDENMYIDGILTKKQQQIKAEWLKKNSTNRATINPFAGR